MVGEGLTALGGPASYDCGWPPLIVQLAPRSLHFSPPRGIPASLPSSEQWMDAPAAISLTSVNLASCLFLKLVKLIPMCHVGTALIKHRRSESSGAEQVLSLCLLLSTARLLLLVAPPRPCPTYHSESRRAKATRGFGRTTGTEINGMQSSLFANMLWAFGQE